MHTYFIFEKPEPPVDIDEMIYGDTETVPSDR